MAPGVGLSGNKRNGIKSRPCRGTWLAAEAVRLRDFVAPAAGLARGGWRAARPRTAADGPGRAGGRAATAPPLVAKGAKGHGAKGGPGRTAAPHLGDPPRRPRRPCLPVILFPLGGPRNSERAGEVVFNPVLRAAAGCRRPASFPRVASNQGGNP